MILKQGLRPNQSTVYRPDNAEYWQVQDAASTIVEKIENATDVFVSSDNGPFDRDPRDGFVSLSYLESETGIYAGRMNDRGEIRYRRWENSSDRNPELGASAISANGTKEYSAIHLLESQPNYSYLNVDPQADGSIKTESGGVTANYILFWDAMTSDVEKYKPGSWA